MNRRNGASLVELLVVISLATTVLAVVGAVFHRMFQSEQLANRAALTELSISRLSNQFRRDVHDALTARLSESLENQLPALELVIPNESPRCRIVYSIEHDKVRRTIYDADSIAAVEVYRLLNCRVAFSVPEPALEATPDQSSPAASTRQNSITALVIERPHVTLSAVPKVASPLRPLVIEAELGRNPRLCRMIPCTSDSSEDAL